MQRHAHFTPPMALLSPVPTPGGNIMCKKKPQDRTHVHDPFTCPHANHSKTYMSISPQPPNEIQIRDFRWIPHPRKPPGTPAPVNLAHILFLRKLLTLSRNPCALRSAHPQIAAAQGYLLYFSLSHFMPIYVFPITYFFRYNPHLPAQKARHSNAELHKKVRIPNFFQLFIQWSKSIYFCTKVIRTLFFTLLIRL